MPTAAKTTVSDEKTRVAREKIEEAFEHAPNTRRIFKNGRISANATLYGAKGAVHHHPQTPRHRLDIYKSDKPKNPHVATEAVLEREKSRMRAELEAELNARLNSKLNAKLNAERAKMRAELEAKLTKEQEAKAEPTSDSTLEVITLMTTNNKLKKSEALEKLDEIRPDHGLEDANKDVIVAALTKAQVEDHNKDA